ncbi:MAG: YdcF family protein [Eggerthellaceae bacterium]|nr:YdcF family protein [Eggerthellaceae bacterium]
MRWKRCLVVGVVLLAICMAVVGIFGRTYTWKQELYVALPSTDDLQVTLGQDDEIIRIEDVRLDGKVVEVTVSGITRGRAFVTLSSPLMEGSHPTAWFDVHPGGIITQDRFFGKCTGGIVFPLAALVLCAYVMFELVRAYRRSMARNLYRYRNVTGLGLIIFLAFVILALALAVPQTGGLDDTVRCLMESTAFLTYLVLPLAFVVSLVVMVTSARLMRREGRTWRNMLGVILGAVLCLLTLLPEVLYTFLLRTMIWDIFQETSVARHVHMFLENGIFTIVAYLECILAATIILAVKAARRVPEFDRDYVLILGCQVAEDGSLPPLLRGRADRALEFAEAQVEAGGPEPVFVPSGGKGADEVCAEGVAIARYLISCGVPEERILIEDRSASTEENLRFSLDLIREDALARGIEDPKIAFSTTNYHVFRTGLLATEQGIAMEGIGAPTKSYFWINAFVREFIATLYEERKVHLVVILGSFAAVAAMVLVNYLSLVL